MDKQVTSLIWFIVFGFIPLCSDGSKSWEDGLNFGIYRYWQSSVILGLGLYFSSYFVRSVSWGNNVLSPFTWTYSLFFVIYHSILILLGISSNKVVSRTCPSSIDQEPPKLAVLYSACSLPCSMRKSIPPSILVNLYSSHHPQTDGLKYSWGSIQGNPWFIISSQEPSIMNSIHKAINHYPVVLHWGPSCPVLFVSRFLSRLSIEERNERWLIRLSSWTSMLKQGRYMERGFLRLTALW